MKNNWPIAIAGLWMTLAFADVAESARVFIVAGQSNAVGFNNITEYRKGKEPFPASLRTQPEVLFWAGRAEVGGELDSWSRLLVADSGSFGPEISMGHDLAKALPGEQIAIIKVAAGGTGIARSQDYTDYIPSLKGFDDGDRNWHPAGDSEHAGQLYEALIDNIRTALKTLEKRGQEPELAGFAWMQGEHEAGISRKMAEDYGQLLKTFITSVRKDLGAPALPFVIGQINSHTWAFGDIARTGQAAVCDSDPNAVLVKTVDLSREGAGGAAHFDADGMLLLGSRFAQALLTFQASFDATDTITLASLLDELVDRDGQACYPQVQWKSLQASSYNRASVARDKPGWFADSDGISCIRQEGNEWVVMEHDGPGCITKMWTPYFYYSMADREGPNIRIYLDGADTPVIDAAFIELLTRNEWPDAYGNRPQQRNSFQVPAPFAGFTARAGDLYLPIPFARSCRITLTSKAFYNIINYRSYPENTPVETFTMEHYRAALAKLQETGRELLTPSEPEGTPQTVNGIIAPGGRLTLTLQGGGAVRKLEVQLEPRSVQAHPELLRSTVLTMTCDNEQTVWCPLGDFFGSPNALNPFNTWTRTASADGKMVCRWVMPYREGACIELLNLGGQTLSASLSAVAGRWQWNERSMYLHASWRSDDIQPGNIFSDWNFIDILGKGVLVGDQWTVLNPTRGWWGEGDEKIYVDDAWDRKFPTHFGTGTEDYYGWAGGRVPTKQDVFSTPFLANISVGSTSENNTRGFNICTRQRGLDAIPFAKRLRFDMEASPGTGQRKATDALGYSAVTWWYARPGATSNRKPLPAEASKPIVSFEDLAQSVQQAVGATAPAKKIENALEFEDISPSAKSPGLPAGPQRPAPDFNPDEVWSNGKHFFVAGRKAGDFVEFRFTERFKPVVLELYLTKSYDFGIVQLSVNGKMIPDRVDLYAPKPVVTEPIRIGPVEPVDNAVTLRVELVGKNPAARGSGSYMGLDCVLLKDQD